MKIICHQNQAKQKKMLSNIGQSFIVLTLITSFMLLVSSVNF